MKYNIVFDEENQQELFLDEIKDLDIVTVDETQFHLLHNNKAYNIHLEHIDLESKNLTFLMNDDRYNVHIQDDLDMLIASMGFEDAEEEHMNEIHAPMPGIILDILCQPGQQLKKGDNLLILEAMKMENIIKTKVAATVKSIEIQKGESVEKDQLLILFEGESGISK